MNFDYSEVQQLLADSVRRFLQDKYGFEQRKKIVEQGGCSTDVWKQFAEMGILGLPISTEHGGFGGGAVDLMGVMEAFGEALVVEPVVPTLVAARFLHDSSLLQAVAEGRLKLAFAHTEKGARYRQDVVATKYAGGALTGEKASIVGAPMADKLVVSAKDGDRIGLFLVDRPELKSYATLDGMRAADVQLHKVKAEKLAGNLDAVEEAMDFGAALGCAEAAGAMKFSCDTTLEYLKTRKQFGVPIGTFQALQHRIVDMFIAYEQARSMACLACSKFDNSSDTRERARAISAAKIKIADAARHISQEAVQLHGGMGMSEELKVSHAFRRLAVLAAESGDADFHLARFASI
jgi:alkylation response protein AidB-like acyl-CoA dehydrogenase